MRHTYTFHIDLEVHDKQALHAAALAKALFDGLSKREAYGHIGTKRSPNISGCLVMLLDPGISPDGTDIAESYTT